MLSRQHRFHGLGSLNQAYRHGQTVRSPMLSLKFVRHEHRRTYRVAVVVSRQISKSAVVRNRIRRRLFEAIAVKLAQVNEPYDLVFTVFSDHLASMPFNKLELQVGHLLVKAGIGTDLSPAARRSRGIVESKGSQGN